MKAELKKEEQDRIMAKNWTNHERKWLVSTYTVAQFKPHERSCNESYVTNELDRQFDQEEQKNKLVDEALSAFHIKRSLSVKGCPCDNAIAKATFKIFKTEFVKGKHIESLEKLILELSD
ncbi:hypothetical protein [Paenibacillus larvae]|uniref:hypothetical protein n=1 Tax=Paenibacillus larvae TaxID=1464 RepID=UPI0026D62D10